LPIVFIALIENWIKSTFAAPHFKSWSSFLCKTTYSGKPESKFWILKLKEKTVNKPYIQEVPLTRNLSQTSCSYSFQVLDLGTITFTLPTNLRTTLTALLPTTNVLWGILAQSLYKLMLSGWYKISTLCSLQF